MKERQITFILRENGELESVVPVPMAVPGSEEHAKLSGIEQDMELIIAHIAQTVHDMMVEPEK